MLGLRHNLLRTLSILGLLLAGCTPPVTAPVPPAPSETPISTLTLNPTAVPPRLPAPALASADPKKGQAEILPGFSLQAIAPQNIRQIVPIAVLQDAIGFHGSVLSADGKRIATATAWGVHVYEVPGGERTVSFSTSGLSILALSPDGSRLAAFYHRLWPAEVVILRSDGKLPGEGDPRMEDQTLDGSKIAMGGSWNGDVRVWSIRNGEQTLLLKGHADVVNQAVFSPDGAMLLTCGADDTLRLWNVATGEALKRFDNPVPGVIISGIWFTSPDTVLIDSSGPDCSGCRSRSWLLDTHSGAVTEQPWDWPAIYSSPDGTWLLRHGAYLDYRLSML